MGLQCMDIIKYILVIINSRDCCEMYAITTLKKTHHKSVGVMLTMLLYFEHDFTVFVIHKNYINLQTNYNTHEVQVVTTNDP